MAAASQRYDFDAPTHVADFMELVNSETDDKWFGTSPFDRFK